MRIKITKPLDSIAPKVSGSKASFLESRIGFWGNVESVNSQNNTVDVTADIGILYRNIPVMSHEWVNATDSKNYVTAERNLPPVGARVFVLTPTRTITGAFVLCSGYARGEADTHTLYAKNDSEQEEKNTVREKITQGGWNNKEDYANGNSSFTSQDGKIAININPVENSDKGQSKEVSLIAWDNEVHISESGITISIPEDADFTLNIQGNQTISVSGDCNIEADGDVNIKGTNIKAEGNVKVTGGTFKAGGTVAPTGTGALCGIPTCPFTGAPHVGDTAANT